MDGRSEVAFDARHELTTQRKPPSNLRIVTKSTLPACLLFLVMILGGCKQEVHVARQPDVAGTYTLVTVNGAKLPATVSHEGLNLQVRSGTFTINADRTCSTKFGLQAVRPVFHENLWGESTHTFKRPGVGTMVAAWLARSADRDESRGGDRHASR